MEKNDTKNEEEKQVFINLNFGMSNNERYSQLRRKIYDYCVIMLKVPGRENALLHELPNSFSEKTEVNKFNKTVSGSSKKIVLIICSEVIEELNYIKTYQLF